MVLIMIIIMVIIMVDDGYPGKRLQFANWNITIFTM